MQVLEKVLYVRGTLIFGATRLTIGLSKSQPLKYRFIFLDRSKSMKYRFKIDMLHPILEKILKEAPKNDKF